MSGGEPVAVGDERHVVVVVVVVEIQGGVDEVLLPRKQGGQ